MANSNPERAQPYVAFTGVTHERQLPEVVNIYETAGFNPETSHRPIAGIAFDLAGRYLNQPIYTPERDIPRIVQVARAAGSISLGTCVHFNGATLQVQEREVLDFLDRLGRRDGLPSILQLNGHLPHPSVLEAIRKQFPELPDLAIQIKPKTDPNEAREAADNLQSAYGGLARLVNMNSSAGTGLRFDIHQRKDAFKELWRAMPDVAIGLPGGLSDANAQGVCENIYDVLNGDDPEAEDPLMFCTDAEGQLKYPDGPLAGHLDLGRARGYVLGSAIAIVRGRTPRD